MTTSDPRSLLRLSLRKVALYVGSCALFVGSLSGVAVYATQKLAATAPASDDRPQTVGGTASVDAPARAERKHLPL